MKKVKMTLAKATEKSLMTVAEIFSTIACWGRSYEPKMPQKLKK